MFSAKFYKTVGSLAGTFYNTHKALETGPAWVKEQYELGAEQNLGDIDGFLGGVGNGLIEGSLEYAKHNPVCAAKMGADLATKVGISSQNGIQFASGFLEKAKLLGQG